MDIVDPLTGTVIVAAGELIDEADWSSAIEQAGIDR